LTVSASDLAARYGRTKRRSRLTLLIAIAFGAAIAIVFGLWAVWGGLFVPGASVETTDVGNTRVSANQIGVKWELSTAPGTKTKCAVQALNSDFGVVGWKILKVPASDQRSRTLTTVVRTSEPAVSGLIYLCWAT
jgi:hypothetical protein